MKQNFTTSETRFLIFILMMVLFSIFSKFAGAQTIVKKDSTGAYIAQVERSAKAGSKDTGRKFRTSEGKLLTIWQGSQGGYYVEMVSKSGKNYRKYIKFQ